MIALPWASFMNWHLCWWKGHAPSLASPALDTFTTLSKNVFWAALPLHVSLILLMISRYSPTVVQCFQGQPPLKAGHLPAIPFICWGSAEYGHAPPLKAGHLACSSQWLTAKGAWSKRRANMKLTVTGKWPETTRESYRMTTISSVDFFTAKSVFLFARAVVMKQRKSVNLQCTHRLEMFCSVAKRERWESKRECL